MVTNAIITGTGVGLEFFNLFEIYSADVFLLSSIVPIKVYSNADTMKQDIIKDNNKKAGIYRWVNNESGNSYVGSSINLSNRLRLYYNYDFISDKSKSKSKSMIHDALAKYGYSKFTFEILEYCDVNKVLEREQHYLDTLNPVYNILKVAGSLFGHKHSEVSKALRSEAMKGKDHPLFGKTHSAETLAKMREAKMGENNPNFGKTHTAETLAKFRKKVFVYSLDEALKESILIKSFDSCSDAAKFFNCSTRVISYYIDKNKFYKNKWMLYSSEQK